MAASDDLRFQCYFLDSLTDEAISLLTQGYLIRIDEPDYPTDKEIAIAVDYAQKAKDRDYE
ncbi:MAG: hypothetical protein AB8B83_07790, partial [Bdellovibrionales bacterium]